LRDLSLPHDTTSALLDGVEFLAPLSADELDALAQKAETVRWDAGRRSSRRGTAGTAATSSSAAG